TMATPAMFVEMARQRGLSPDGRCRAFGSGADGTGWAEGVGLLVLERLSDARSNHHRVLAVLAGSAVNQDGASNGLTSPNGPSQQRVIRAALANAGLTPADIDAVEAHGTGTTLGDPIEAQAVLAAYGQDRERPLWLGSVKSNLGHTQAAAGVAGVIKTVLALRQGVLPRTLHVTAPSSHVDWTAGSVRLLTERTPWPVTGAPRRAGVSSFGVGGTNAHVILEGVEPAETGAPAVVSGPVPWVLSGRTPEALRAQADRLRRHVGAGWDAADVGLSLATTRSAFEHRMVLLGDTTAELMLETAPVIRGVGGPAGKTAFVFPGQGAQWVGMGAELLDSAPVFADRIAECAAALAPFVDWSLVDVLRHGEVDRVDVVQPASWAVMVALAALYSSHGVRPAAVVGHSQGEIAAACVAGALSLADGARVVALRSKLIASTLAGRGGMASIALSEDEIRLTDALGIAAVNGPRSVVVSGDSDALDELVARCVADGVRARRIPVDYASHSAHVEAIETDLLAALAPITPHTSDIAFCSTVSGPTTLDAAYWYRNLRQTVHLDTAVRGLVDRGYTAFVEVGTHPVLVPAIQETLDDVSSQAAVLGTLRRDDGGLPRFRAALAELWCHGVSVDWTAALPGARTVELPTYAFQRQRYWLTGSADTRLWTDGDLHSLAADLDVDPEALLAWQRQRNEKSTVDSWRYRIGWHPLTSSPTGRLDGRWLLVGPDCGLADRLTARGAEVIRLDVEHLAELDMPVAGVLSTLALDEQPHPDHPALTVGLAQTVRLVQALADVVAPLWIVTRGAVFTGRADPLTSPAQAQVWGAGRVVGLEHPDRWGGLIDLPAVLDGRAADRLCSVLTGNEDQVAVRASGVFARRLRPAPLGDARPRREWRPTGTVLITGGTGALGAHVARDLAKAGAERLVLTSRRGGADGLVDELAALGATATVVACDVADRDALAALLADLSAHGTPVRSVVHAAGVGNSALLADTDLAEFADTLRAKVAGAINLDELTGDDLDAFVLFSSNA
ncbi:MAG TPA: type I polyketide synthase, partial [Pseudonocardiaceae bacterium]|nr:type I polyketide synthase [Pseudonocardiaceae bacterium]